MWRGRFRELIGWAGRSSDVLGLSRSLRWGRGENVSALLVEGIRPYSAGESPLVPNGVMIAGK